MFYISLTVKHIQKISLWAEENNVKIRYFESGVFENSLFFSDNFAASAIFNFDKNEKNDLSKIRS